jgi:hypothetical protein
MPSLTDALCTRCGLCCDGTLFADVELSSRAESSRLEILGLEIEAGDTRSDLLVLPCRALRGRQCSIYPHRPKCCRTFECGLLQRAQRGDVSVRQAQHDISRAQAQIASVEDLLARLGAGARRMPLKERCQEALSVDTPGRSGMDRTRAKLKAAMSAVEQTIRSTFLG